MFSAKVATPRSSLNVKNGQRARSRRQGQGQLVLKSGLARLARLFTRLDQIPDGSGRNSEVSVAQFSTEKSALLQAEERSARVSAVKDVLPLLVVPEGRDVAALDARRFVAVESAFVDSEPLHRRLDDFEDKIVCSKIGQIVVWSKIGQVVGSFCDGRRDVVRNVAFVALFVFFTAGFVAFLLLTKVFKKKTIKLPKGKNILISPK